MTGFASLAAIYCHSMALSCNDAVMRAAVLMSWATGPCRTIAMLRNCAPGRAHSLSAHSFVSHLPPDLILGYCAPMVRGKERERESELVLKWKHQLAMTSLANSRYLVFSNLLAILFHFFAFLVLLPFPFSSPAPSASLLSLHASCIFRLP